jgi:putative (di)nucleoside polyphosphate hydrolase
VVVPATRDYIDWQGFRANVGIVLISDDQRVLLGGRAGARGWQFPQGGILEGERAEAALYRELQEETGLESGDVEELGRTRGWLRYRLPPQFQRRNSSPVCIGQKQRWFLLRMKAPESRLRFDATQHPAEFDRWRWADYWDPVREVIYFKRRVYARALAELGEYAFPGGLPPYPEWWEERMATTKRSAERPAAS